MLLALWVGIGRFLICLIRFDLSHSLCLRCVNSQTSTFRRLNFAICLKFLKPMLLPSENAKDTTMDNKQATPSETDLAYFAGIIDGEGWIGLLKKLRKNRWITYHPCIRVTNTDPNIIEKIQSVWENLGVRGHLYEHTQGPSIVNGKPVMYIQIQKHSLIKITLEALIPFLVGKKARAIMLLRFIDGTVDREEAHQAIKKANQKGIHEGESSETTREAPVFMDEDIVHPAEKSGG